VSARDGTPIDDDLTVIVPTIGRPVLRKCLRSLMECTSWPARLVVVDQSADRVVEGWLADVRAAGLDVLHVRAPRRGVGAARNRGVERVETTFFAINDDDQLRAPRLDTAGARSSPRSP
jgi:glycosyltransferase involved in cell wall biosynthesis